MPIATRTDARMNGHLGTGRRSAGSESCGSQGSLSVVAVSSMVCEITGDSRLVRRSRDTSTGDQIGLDDDPVPRRTSRMAGEHRHHRFPEVVGDPEVVWFDDKCARYSVHDVETVPIFEIDQVAFLQTVEVPERMRVGRSVTGEYDVSQTARLGRPRPVRHTAVDHGQCDTGADPVSYTHLRAHETVLDLVCRLLLEKKKKKP